MTYEEAIKAMRFYKEKLYNGIFNQFIAAFDVAISALEKQIPKKPENREGTTYFYCPCCDSNNAYEYCGDCGQALDWSDTE